MHGEVPSFCHRRRSCSTTALARLPRFVLGSWRTMGRRDTSAADFGTDTRRLSYLNATLRGFWAVVLLCCLHGAKPRNAALEGHHGDARHHDTLVMQAAMHNPGYETTMCTFCLEIVPWRARRRFSVAHQQRLPAAQMQTWSYCSRTPPPAHWSLGR